MGCGRMKVAAADLWSTMRTGAGRLGVTWILLLAFTLQAYITQTHVHLASSAADRAPVVAAGVAAFAQRPAPKGDETIACPFCQAIASAGAFVGPAALILGPPAGWAAAGAPAPVAAGLQLASAGFSWRSRAPPRP